MDCIVSAPIWLPYPILIRICSGFRLRRIQLLSIKVDWGGGVGVRQPLGSAMPRTCPPVNGVDEAVSSLNQDWPRATGCSHNHQPSRDWGLYAVEPILTVPRHATSHMRLPAHTCSKKHSRLYHRGSERWQRGDTLPSRWIALSSRRGSGWRIGHMLTPIGFIPPLDRSRRKDRRPRRASMPMWWGPSPVPVLRTSPLIAKPSRKAHRNWSGKCPPQGRSGAR